MKKRVKERKKKHRIGCLIALILVTVGIVSGALWVKSMGDSINSKEFPTDDYDLGIDEQEDEITKSTLGNNSIVNIALFGTDAREGETNSRTDSIIILSVDKQNGQVKLSSIMRDSLVDIDGYGQSKINKAYYLGGPQLAVKTLNQNFNLNIREYATVDFSQMAGIIDAVGGIEIDISEEERENANISISEQAEVAGLSEDYIEKAGLQNLNGTQAVAYARIRYVGNADYQRTTRQREVLRKLFDKALSLDTLKYPSVAKQLFKMTETSLDLSDIMSLADVLVKKPALQDVRFPTNEDLIGNGSIFIDGEDCLNFDKSTMSQRLHDFIYNNIDPTTAADRDSNGESISIDNENNEQ